MTVKAAQQLPRLVIERVSPELDAGRYPVKRVVGDTLEISADIFKDGHDLLAARVLFRGPDEERWREVRLDYRFNPDRWYGEITLDRLGRWQYTIEAWPDRYRSWRSDLEKRLGAEQDVASELLEGAKMLERAAKRLGAAGQAVRNAARTLGDEHADQGDRLRVAFSNEVLEAIYGPLEPSDAARYDRVLEVVVNRELAGFGAWYELFPRSQSRAPGRHGTFADVARRLPGLADLGFHVIYLPPVHPIGVTHRKGKNNARLGVPGDVGSPWAIGSAEGGHTALHPQLGNFADFQQMVRRANELGLEIALDYALQCSPDHPWVSEHPEWFFIRPDGTIRYAENPPKKYEDIYPLNFWCADREGLWNACLDIVLFWIGHGVKIFRVDNPHTKPLVFWEWLIGETQRRHPDTVFLAEAFTRPKRMKALAKLGFSQSYTYFTWKNTAEELREYLSELTTGEMPEFFRPNFFANTPDILHEYLQHGGRPAFRVRLLLAATLAPVYGIYSGYELCENVPVHAGSEEYLDSEKYELKSRDFDAPGSIKSDIARLNAIRRDSPALRRLANLSFLPTDHEQVLAYRKSAPGDELIVVVNLDPTTAHEAWVTIPLADLGLSPEQPFDVEDLLTGERYVWRGARNYVRLDPSDKVGHLLRVGSRAR
jgi:starch synthase (maltosyl-transferring)